MGEPALVTILHEDQPAESFTWRSGGYSLGSDLIAFGVDGLIADHLDWGWTKEPEEGIEAARINLGWAESSLIIDFPRRTLIWDLNCLDIEQPRLVSHLIEQSSPGWRAAWSPYGDDAIWRYLNANPFITSLTPSVDETQYVQEEDWFAPFTDPSESFGEDTLFTAVLVDGTPACWLSDKSVDQVSNAKISSLERIARTMTGTEFERYPVWPFDEDWYKYWPQGGVHLDFRQRRAWRWSYWGIRWDHFILDAWPGWNVVEIGDYCEIQEPYINGRALQPPLESTHETDEQREPTGYRSPGEIRSGELLRELSTSGRHIPPTAYLQPDGTVCWDPSGIAPNASR